MSKVFRDLGSKKEKYYVIMKIISVEIPVKEKYTNVHLEWKRGSKKSNTKQTLELTPQNPVAVFLETFSKHSVFYTKNNTIYKKLINIRIKGTNEQKKDKLLGEIDLNISEFVGNVRKEMDVALNKALPNSTISIDLTITKELSGNMQAPIGEHEESSDEEMSPDSNQSIINLSRRC